MDIIDVRLDEQAKKVAKFHNEMVRQYQDALRKKDYKKYHAIKMIAHSIWGGVNLT